MTNLDRAVARHRERLTVAAARGSITVMEDGSVLRPALPTPTPLRESLGGRNTGALTVTGEHDDFTITFTSDRLTASELRTVAGAGLAVAAVAAAGTAASAARETSPSNSAATAEQPAAAPAPAPTDQHIDALLPRLDQPGGTRAMADLLAQAYAPTQPVAATPTHAAPVTRPPQLTDAELDALVPQLDTTQGRREMQTFLGDHYFGSGR